MKTVILAAVLATTVAAPAAAATDLVTNGTFYNSIDGWQSDHNPYDLGWHWNAAGSARTGTPENFPHSVLSQSEATTVGASYRLSFDAQPGYMADSGSGLDVYFGATKVFSMTNPTDWSMQSYTFDGLVATDAATVLRFVGYQTWGVMDLDNVSLVQTAPAAPVPEPGAWAVTILGCGVIGGALRLGRRRKDDSSLRTA